jgi:hypothetical protein
MPLNLHHHRPMRNPQRKTNAGQPGLRFEKASVRSALLNHQLFRHGSEPCTALHFFLPR